MKTNIKKLKDMTKEERLLALIGLLILIFGWKIF